MAFLIGPEADARFEVKWNANRLRPVTIVEAAHSREPNPHEIKYV
jgi:hypothetical protein